MGYSRYYGNATANGAGTLVHVVSNPDNANFGWLLNSHLELRLSSAGQSLAAFTTEVEDGLAKLSLYNDYNINGSSIEIPNLTASAVYQFYISRITPKLSHFVDFQAGSPITETDLDNSNKYALFRFQELEDVSEQYSPFILTLAKMKTVAGITGEFTGDTDTQTMTNKTFTAGAGITSSFDLGTASWQ
jgi:hypothetical protein